jgi:hypothetical protein
MMAQHATSDILYPCSAILIGTAIITFVLRFVRLDVKPFLATRPGRNLTAACHKFMSIVLDSVAISDVLTISPDGTLSSSRGYLETLTQREGPRPHTNGSSRPSLLKPLNATDDKNLQQRLRDLIIDLTEKYPQATYLGRSSFEPDLPTNLFARYRSYADTKYYGEIVSANPKDGFIHAVLHPSDVKVVLEKGWAQRDPLSSRMGTMVQRITDADHSCAKEGTQVLVYPPRDQADLVVIREIINAAVWFAAGIDERVDGEKL